MAKLSQKRHWSPFRIKRVILKIVATRKNRGIVAVARYKLKSQHCRCKFDLLLEIYYHVITRERERKRGAKEERWKMRGKRKQERGKKKMRRKMREREERNAEREEKDDIVCENR